MNALIKLIAFIWLMLCALISWVGCACIGFLFMFSSTHSWIGNVTPFVGLTIAICIIKCAMYILLKSNPEAYLAGKMDWIEGKLFGKTKI